MTRDRESLIKLIPSLVRNVTANQQILPARIVALYSFGSVYRVANPHDLDLLFTYEQDDSQRDEWWRFKWTFSTGHGAVDDDPEIERSLRASRELHRVLDKLYYELGSRRPAFSEASKRADVLEVANRVHLNLNWASCFSWSHYIHGQHGDGMFMPEIETVLSRYIVGRLAQKGLQVHFMEASEFGKPGGRMNLVDPGLYEKIWDPSMSLEQIPGPEQFTATRKHFEIEFLKLREQAAQAIPDLVKQASEVIEAARRKRIHVPPLKLIPAIPSKRIPASDKSLRQMCTELRAQVRTLNAVGSFIESMSIALAESEVTSRATLTCALLDGLQPEVETERRELCRKLGLPEAQVVLDRTAIGRSAFARKAILEPSSRKRGQIVAQGLRVQAAHKLELKTQHLLPEDNWWVSVQLIPSDRAIPILVGGYQEDKIRITGTGAFLCLSYDFPDGSHLSESSKSRLTKHGWSVREEVGATYALRTFTIDTRDKWENIKQAVTSATSEFHTDYSASDCSRDDSEALHSQ